MSNPNNAPSAAPVWASGNMMSYALTGAVVALLGVLVSVAVLYFAVIASGNAKWTDSQVRNQTVQYANVLNGRIALLDRIITGMAASNLTRGALAGRLDPAAAAADLQAVTPHALAVRIFAPGTAQPDLAASPPVNFAAIDMVSRAESGRDVLPEAYAWPGGTLFHAAAPVLDADGKVLGTVLATLSMDFFTDPLGRATDVPGLVTVEQRFDDNTANDVISLGDASSADTDRGDTVVLAAGHWTLSFQPGPALTGQQPFASLVLLVPLLVLLATTAGGIWFGYRRLHGHLHHDADMFVDFMRRAIGGQARVADEYHLDLFDRLARALRQRVADTGAAGTTTKPAPVGVPQRTAAAPKQELEDILEIEELADDDLLDIGDDLDQGDLADPEPAAEPAAGPAVDGSIFRAYDIRGVVGDNLTEEVAELVGRALGAEAQGRGLDSFVVGGDGRLSSPVLKTALAKGLQDSGMRVIDVGEVPTPVLYFAIEHLGTGSGVMVTGSHNPPEYNGLKMVLGGETLAEGAIQRLLERINKQEFVTGNGGLSNHDVMDAYVDRITGDIAIAQPLKVVLDCGNGVAGKVAPRLIQALGCEVVPLFCEVDGTFPNHHPDPADPANLNDLILRVDAEDADLGLAFDGDGDRVGLVTNTGRIIWPDRMLMLFARDIVGRNPGADVIYDVKCSRHLNTLISEFGGRPIMWKTGHSHIKKKLKETGALLAGEFSGHICFGERWYGFDDGLYSAARLLEIVGAETQTVEELFEQFPNPASTPEMKIHTTDEAKFKVLEQLAKEGDFGDGTLTTIDGIRVDYTDGWGLIRPSNTSPVLTLRFEADTEEALERVQATFREQLGRIDSALVF